MKSSLFAAFVLGSIFASKLSTATEADGYVPLFNGKDLNGWVNVNCAPKTFTVRDGIIVSTGVPTGVMRTERQYENFELDLEWRHMTPGGNAGLFVWADPITSPGVPFARAIEVQILDGRNSEVATSHGDLSLSTGPTSSLIARIQRVGCAVCRASVGPNQPASGITITSRAVTVSSNWP